MKAKKILIVVLIALLAVPSTTVATRYTVSMTGANSQRLVEGHTSYAILAKQTNICTPNLPPVCPPVMGKENATAVAVLTSEYQCVITNPNNDQFNGVLWFNDQFLLGRDDGNTGMNGNYTTNAWQTCGTRYPCGGTIYAVSPPGSANPGPTGGTYIESYRIVDPNNNVWLVDLFRHGTVLAPIYKWTINIHASGASADGVADSTNPYTNCAPLVDTASASATANTGSYPNTLTYPTITYNGLLFMRWTHLIQSGSVEYGYNPTLGADAMEDTRDGNSHPWNNGPTAATAADTHTHATAKVDIYYSYRGRTQPSRLIWVNDNVGSAAPFDTHP